LLEHLAIKVGCFTVSITGKYLRASAYSLRSAVTGITLAARRAGT